MENKHKAAGKESMVIKNQKQNALKSKQKGSQVKPNVKSKKTK